MLMHTINQLEIMKLYNGKRIKKKEINLGLISWLVIIKKSIISSTRPAKNLI